MKLRVWSPLPPSPSGIADYMAEQLPVLARHHQLTLVCDEAARVDVAMVTVDPARDTPVLTDYIQSFVDGAHAIATDDQAALQSVAGPFGVSYEVRTLPDGEVEVFAHGERGQRRARCNKQLTSAIPEPVDQREKAPLGVGGRTIYFVDRHEIVSIQHLGIVRGQSARIVDQQGPPGVRFGHCDRRAQQVRLSSSGCAP